MNLTTDLGVQSYCFREFKDNAQVAKMVRELDLTKIELCGIHIDFNDASSYDKVIDTYGEAGIQIVSVGVQGGSGDEAAERGYFEFAKRAGVKHISISFNVNAFPQCYRVTEKLAAEYDIVLGIHNHGGYHWLGSSEMLGRVFNDTNDSIGLCIDTAWALDAKQNPVEMAKRFQNRLYGAHIKDFVFDRARNQTDVIVGEGNLDLPAFLAVLNDTPTLKMCVLEYEGDAENPVPQLQACVQAVRSAL